MRPLTTAALVAVIAAVVMAAATFGGRSPQKAVPPVAPVAVKATAADPHAPAADAKKPVAANGMTAEQCAAACTKKMNDMGMEGSCPVEMCKPGVCPMMSAAHGEKAGPEPSKTPATKS
jgi:hypothetical protein